MKEGRSQILILRSLIRKDLQDSTRKKVLQHLLSIKDDLKAEKRAEELIKIIDSAASEEEILKALKEAR